MSAAWKLPAPGDIVWCLFPEIPDIQPGPKPRPALVMRLKVEQMAMWSVWCTAHPNTLTD